MKAMMIWLWAMLLAIGAQAQEVRAVKAGELMQGVSSNDTLYVINFWATWCGPCVKEISIFNELAARYANRPVKVLLVSLDFKEGYPKKIQAFINKKKLTPEVVWLNETNANEFIPRIEPQWQGSIPATLILYPKNSYRNFFEGVVTSGQLSLLIDKQLAY